MAPPAPETQPQAAPPPPDEQEQEQRLGADAGGIAANRALLALARAARSFLIYDARNDAIRGFLGDWRDSMGAFSSGHGALELDVRPFELIYQGQVVYLERDRERSLAFRLFRDGVRKLSIEADAPWDELLRLLEILSIRYSGVRQQEDDIVTLLWKAGFKCIQVEAVEGVVLDDGQGQDAPRERGLEIQAPADRDQPLPALLSGALLYRPLDPAALTSLREEEDSRGLGSLCMRLVQRLVAAVGDPTDPASASELVPLVEEIREFMLGEQQLGTLLELLDVLREGLAPELSEPLTRGFVSQRALRRIVRSVQHTHNQPPPELFALLDKVPGEHLHTFATLLELDRDPDSRRINRQLLEHLGRARPQALMALVETAPPGVISDLFRAAHAAAPKLCLERCAELALRGDSELQQEILRYLEQGDPPGDVLPVVFSLCESPQMPVRVRALSMLRAGQDARIYPFLLTRLEQSSELKMREADAIGHAMATQAPRRVGPMFLDWVRPAKLFGRLFGGTTPGQRNHQWVALAGLEQLPDVDAEDSVKWLQRRAGEELARRCQATLVRRRKRQEGRDG